MDMPELESLMSRASDLTSKVDFWNSAVLWALLITALAASALVVSQRLAFVRAKQLADVQDKINNIKEANAKLVQERVETELAMQQQRAATAERSLLELQERVKLRHLSAEQRKKLIDFLNTPAAAAVAKGPIRVQSLLLDETAQPLALDIKEALAAAGWPSGEIGREMIPAGGRTHRSNSHVA